MAAAVLPLDFETAQIVLHVKATACLPAFAATLAVRAPARQVRRVEVAGAVRGRVPAPDAQMPPGLGQRLQSEPKLVEGEQILSVNASLQRGAFVQLAEFDRSKGGYCGQFV